MLSIPSFNTKSYHYTPYTVRKNISKLFSLNEIKEYVILNNVNIHSKKYESELLSSLDRAQADVRSFRSILNEGEYSTVFKLSLLNNETEHSIIDLISFSNKIKLNFGEEVFVQLFNKKYFKPNQIQLIISTLELFLSLKDKPKVAEDMLDILLETEDYEVLNKNLNKYLESGRSPSRELKDVLQDCIKLNPNVTTESFNHLEEQYLNVLSYVEKLKFTSDEIIKNNCLQMKKHLEAGSLKLKDKLYLLAAGSLRIQKEFGIFPHSTQLLTVLALTSPIADKKGCIAQVNTGEGKSIINTLLALYVAAEGKCVDIITSEESLSIRDQAKFKNFFNSFGIKSSHICDRELTKEHFSGQIIYGTNTDFEFSLLREQTSFDETRRHFEENKKPRPCEVVLVDEVDNLFVDKASNSAMIAISSNKNLSPLFSYLFHFIKNYEVQSQVPPIFQICKVIRETTSEESPLGKILSSISDDEIEIYIKNACVAIWEKIENSDYIIKTKDEKDLNGIKSTVREVVIMDKDTGSLSEGCEWEEGLHEFIQIKHNISIKESTISFASLCHPIFFEKYAQVYGLSGTLGSEIEQKEVEEIYQVSTIKVPPYRSSLRITEEPIICLDEIHFEKSIVSEILNMQKSGCPVLILCPDIKDVKEVQKLLFESKMSCQIYTGTQLTSEEFILSRAGIPGAVTVATNKASRGTDIILTSQSIDNGGLHVVLTYFPESERVEAQAVGRAGRQGQPGSSRMIVHPNDILLKRIMKNNHLKKMVREKPLYVHEAMLVNRKKQITDLSKERAFQAKIDICNNNFTELFFNQFKLFNDCLDSKLFNSLIRKDSDKYSISKLEEKKHLIKEELSLKWALFFKGLKNTLKDIRERERFSKLHEIKSKYRKEVEKSFKNFEAENEFFFKDPIKYFLSEMNKDR